MLLLILGGGHILPQLACGAEDLRHRVDADNQNDHGHAALQLVHAEGEALGKAVEGAQADAGDKQADEHADVALEHTAADEGADEAQGKHHQSEVVPWAELNGDLGQRGGQEGQHDGAEGAADKGAVGSDGHSLSSQALFAHGIAVKGGGDGGGGAGDAQQDGADQAAGDAAHVHAEEQRHGGDGAQLIGEGQQQRHGDGGVQAGDGAEDNAYHCADTDQQQHLKAGNLS